MARYGAMCEGWMRRARGTEATHPWQMAATGFWAATMPEMIDSIRGERRM